MKYFLSLLIFLIFFGFAPRDKDRSIPWSPRQLTWADFQGKPHPRSNVGAVTYSGMRYSFEGNSNAYNITVVATFDPERSWVNKKAANNHVLRHEQLHFDITELYARKMRAALKKISPGTQKPDVAASKLYNRYTNESREYQDRYDHETDHSRNEAKQAFWDKKITGELAALDHEAGTVITITARR